MSILSCIASTSNELRGLTIVFLYDIKEKKLLKTNDKGLIDISMVRQSILTLIKSFTKILKVYYKHQM